MRYAAIVCIVCLIFYPVWQVTMVPTPAKQGMVVTEQSIASQVGLNILQSGGNAVDAAVAVGYALAVVNPCCGNIGGGGFMNIHLASGENIFLNFREKAPLKAGKDMYLDTNGNLIPDATTKGYLAVAVPGTVLGLDTALKKYGTMTRKQVMAPAIALARSGYPVSAFDATIFQQYAPDFRQQPNVAAIFLRRDQPFQANQRLLQYNLANTLMLIAEQGPDAFYKGPIAQAIVKASQEHGGILTLQDFSSYTVEELQPIYCTYRGYTIISSPPPSSGGTTLCETLNILENFPLRQTGFHTAQSLREIIEAMRYGFNDRNTKLGDPDFVSNPVSQLTSKEYAAQLSNMIRTSHFAPAHVESTPHEHSDTTHYSIVDSMGNAVSTTYTLNGYFGAKVIADGTGFFLNDEMDDFAAKLGAANKFGLVQFDQNAIQPGKRPLSSMTPTIVTKDGKVFLVLGSPGGPRIITSVLLTLLNVIDYAMNIQQAVATPRFHYQGLPDIVFTEPLAIPYQASIILQHAGYHFQTQPPWSAVEAIEVNPSDGVYSGANDPRRPAGAALGY
jgi:gamma-glutamyltranspeptidase/glutathione hydrolase